MAEVAHLRHRLLTQEAPFREVDRLLESGFRRQGVRPEVRSHACNPTVDPPGLDVVGSDLGEPSAPSGVRGSLGGARPRARRCRARCRGPTAQGRARRRRPGEPRRRGRRRSTIARPVLELDVGGEHVGSEDRVDRLGLLARLEEEEGVVVAPRDVEVGADPPGRSQDQRASALSGLEPFHVGRDEIVEPGAGVGAPHHDRSPPGQQREGAPALERVRSRRSRATTSSREHAWFRIVGVERACVPSNAGARPPSERISVRWRYPGPSS